MFLTPKEQLAIIKKAAHQIVDEQGVLVIQRVKQKAVSR